MSKLSNRMIRDMQLAGLVEGTQNGYLRAVRQLAAYYMISPDRLTERNVENYILYIRDELGVAKGTFAPTFFGLKFFYLFRRSATTGRCSQKKSPQANPRAIARRPQ
jgi:integrase/recombinase XerD